MSWGWDLVRDFGALVGLLTGVYVLAERWTKHYPTAILIPRPLGDFGRQTVYLSIANRGDRPILIRLPNGSTNGHFRAAIDHSSRAIIEATLRGETWLPMNPGEQKHLPLLRPPDFAELSEDSEIAFSFSWRFAQPILWRGDRRKTISIQKFAFRRLEQDRYEQEDDND